MSGEGWYNNLLQGILEQSAFVLKIKIKMKCNFSLRGRRKQHVLADTRHYMYVLWIRLHAFLSSFRIFSTSKDLGSWPKSLGFLQFFSQDHRRKVDFVLVYEEDKKDVDIEIPKVNSFHHVSGFD